MPPIASRASRIAKRLAGAARPAGGRRRRCPTARRRRSGRPRAPDHGRVAEPLSRAGTALPRNGAAGRRYRHRVERVNTDVEKRASPGILRACPRPRTQSAPDRGRRAVAPTGDDRELAILATAERLLAERPLQRDLGRRPGPRRRHLAADLLLLLRLQGRRPADPARPGGRRGRRERRGEPSSARRGPAALAGDGRSPRYYETFRAHRGADRWRGAEARATQRRGARRCGRG